MRVSPITRTVNAVLGDTPAGIDVTVSTYAGSSSHVVPLSVYVA